MTETPRYVPDISERSAFDPPFSHIRTVPYYLRRRVLKQIKFEEGHIPEKLWTQRARAVEIYVQDVVATQKDNVDEVVINKAWDEQGPDLIGYLANNLPVEKVCIEVKSSSLELRNGKQKIRDEMLSETTDGKPISKRAFKQALKEWNRKPEEEREKIEKIRRQKRKRSKRAKEKILTEKHQQAEKKTLRSKINPEE